MYRNLAMSLLILEIIPTSIAFFKKNGLINIMMGNLRRSNDLDLLLHSVFFFPIALLNACHMLKIFHKSAIIEEFCKQKYLSKKCF